MTDNAQRGHLERQPLTPNEAHSLLRLIEQGRSDPDLWTRDERAAVSALFAIRDGRR